MCDVMKRRHQGFVLWRPARTVPTPRVQIVELVDGNPPTESPVVDDALVQSTTHPDLWELPLAQLSTPLIEGRSYHYWFIVANDRPGAGGSPVRCTDPFARVVDYRLGDRAAAVIKLNNEQLVDCDPDGQVGVPARSQNLLALAPNNRLVLYELPSSWTRTGDEGHVERDVGTFRDVLALFDPAEPGGNFGDVPEVSSRAHLAELGVNAIELLPPADSPFKREWGYGTGNYFAGDWDLGFPEGNQSPTTEQDLRRLVATLHGLGIRFFADMVLAFGHTSYREINFDDFYIVPSAERNNPDAYQSSRDNELRSDFGGNCWRYLTSRDSYDPVAGNRRTLVPTQQFLLAHLIRWMDELGVDGVRLDSINNIANWDFLETFTKAARDRWRAQHSGAPASAADARFLVVGEELSVPLALVPRRLDGLWNEQFQPRLRAAIRGRPLEGMSFEQTVRDMVDCRRLGFQDGTQAINYITSHDVEGFEKERIFLFLELNDIPLKEERVKLAFACLLTAVGIPMILAGEEFADQHDRTLTHPDKQKDPLNFSRLKDPWRRRVFDYVARLVSFRKTSVALSVNDTNFIHADFSGGRRILAWVRGDPAQHDPVVIVANFSDVRPEGSEYRVPNWPATPPGRSCREVSQNRSVPIDWIGREPLFPWEAKIYTLT
jgi:pullulanase